MWRQIPKTPAATGEKPGDEEVWGPALEMEGTAGEAGDRFAELGAGVQEHTREGLSAAVMLLIPFPPLVSYSSFLVPALPALLPRH